MADRVPFVYADWVAIFPQFAAAPPQVQVEFCVPFAEQYWRNDGTSPATTVEQQRTLLYLMVAHVVQIMYGPAGTGASGVVGFVNSASEGSVSISAEWPVSPDNAWFLQTPFGAMFWQMTAAYRTMRYLPGPRRNMNPWPPFTGPVPWNY